MYIDLIGLDSTGCGLQAAYAPQGSMKRRAELAPNQLLDGQQIWLVRLSMADRSTTETCATQADRLPMVLAGHREGVF